MKPKQRSKLKRKSSDLRAKVLGAKKIDPRDRNKALRLLNSIDKELNKPDPDVSKIREWLKTISQLFKTIKEILLAAAALVALLSAL